MKKDECLTADWYNIGYEDGASGYQTARIAQHRKSCSKYGVAPDLHLYQKGRFEGLYDYCTPHKGYQLGLNGRGYADVCQGELKDQFQQAYNIGRDIYLFQRDVQKEQRDQRYRKEDLVNIENLIKEKEANLSMDCKHPDTCRQALNEIRDLDKEKNRLNSMFRSKKYQIEKMQQALYDMKSHNRY